MNKVNLVVLSAFLSPMRSGAEAMVEEVSKRLPQEFDVTIITGRYKRSLPKHDILGERVKVVRVGFGLSFDKYLYPLLAPLVVLRRRPQIIHAVLESYAGLALILCRFLSSSAKRVLTLQSTNTAVLLGPMHRSAHRMTAISTALAQRAKEFTAADVAVIPNGVDLEAIREACKFHAKDSGRILFVGRLEPVKGVDVLLRAFASIASSLSPDANLRIVGDGSEKEKLAALARELEIDHRVMFAGLFPHAAVYDEYAKATLFCGLSRSEAFGNVFLEAQAAGCAVIATNVGGIPEVVKDGVTGILVPPDDVSSAAQAIKTLMKDSSLRARFSVAAEKDKERYGWGNIAERYAEVLRAL